MKPQPLGNAHPAAGTLGLARLRALEPGVAPGQSRHCDASAKSGIPRRRLNHPNVDPDGGHLDQNRAATDLFSARASQADYVYGNPVKLNVGAVKKLVDGAELVVFRFLGGEEQLPKTFTTCVESGLPLVVLGGQHTPDAALMELSTVPMGVAAQARSYFVQGGLDNLRTVHAFLADTVLLTGDAFEPVSMMPVWSELLRPDAPTDEPAGHRRPRIGVILYRAHYAASNIAHIIALADAPASSVPIPAPTVPGCWS